MVLCGALLVGCPSDDPPGSDWLAPPSDPTPGLDATAVEQGALDALDALLAVDADTVWDIWSDLAARADDGCPAFSSYAAAENVHVRGWQTTCTSADGVTFAGLGAEVLWDGYLTDELVVDGWSVRLDGEVRDAVRGLRSTGGALRSVYADHVEFPFWLRTWEGGGVHSGGDDLQITLQWQAVRALPVDARYVVLDGSVSGLSGPMDAAAFTALTMLDDTLAGDCAGEPAGTLSLREAESGAWWDIVFHGRREADESVEISQCDGCGDAWYQGARQGQVCVDARALLEWNTTPW